MPGIHCVNNTELECFVSLRMKRLDVCPGTSYQCWQGGSYNSKL